MTKRILVRALRRGVMAGALMFAGICVPRESIRAQANGYLFCPYPGAELIFVPTPMPTGITVYPTVPAEPEEVELDPFEAQAVWSGKFTAEELSARRQPGRAKCDVLSENIALEIEKLFSSSTPNVSGGTTGSSSGGGTSGLARPASLHALAVGDVAVGYVDRGDFTPFHAFRWTEATGSVDLGTLDPANNATRSSMATGTNTDGSVVVGFSDIGAGQTQHAFRWTQATGMVDLGSPGGAARDSRALAANGTGDVIVGDALFPDQIQISGFRTGAFRWTESGGFQNLGALQPGYFTVATDVSADGAVIVGQGGIEVVNGTTSTNGSRAFRWTSTTGLVAIDPLPGHQDGIALGVSDNGKVVVGISGAGSYNPVLGHGKGTAFRWTERGGTQDLRRLLVDAGLDLTGIQLVSATAISADGQWIVGNAVTPTTPAGETRPFVAKYCDADIGGACTPLVAPVASFALGTNGSTSMSVAAGTSASATLTITPSNGFDQAVSFACSGLPAESTCTFAPVTVTPNGTAAATTTLTITTSAPRRGMSFPVLPPGGWLSVAVVIAGLLLLRGRVVHRSIRPVAAGVMLILTIGSCSGGGGDGGTDPPPPPLIGGTPAGTFPVTVTATSGTGAGALSRTLQITLTVTR